MREEFSRLYGQMYERLRFGYIIISSQICEANKITELLNNKM